MRASNCFPMRWLTSGANGFFCALNRDPLRRFCCTFASECNVWNGPSKTGQRGQYSKDRWGPHFQKEGKVKGLIQFYMSPPLGQMEATETEQRRVCWLNCCDIREDIRAHWHQLSTPWAMVQKLGDRPSLRVKLRKAPRLQTELNYERATIYAHIMIKPTLTMRVGLPFMDND